MKQKIQCEIEIEADCEMEFVGVRRAEAGEYYFDDGGFHRAIDRTLHRSLIFRPVEPPLELETPVFVSLINNGNLKLGYDDAFFELTELMQVNKPQARDLAKILNYWAEKGKLPKVKLKEQHD